MRSTTTTWGPTWVTGSSPAAPTTEVAGSPVRVRLDTFGRSLHRSHMRVRTWLIGVVIAPVLLAGTTAALACPAPPPDTPTIREMIMRGSTEDEHFPLLLLGRVRATRDLRGGPNGNAIARFRVIEDAIGRVPGFVRVRFYRRSRRKQMANSSPRTPCSSEGIDGHSFHDGAPMASWSSCSGVRTAAPTGRPVSGTSSTSRESADLATIRNMVRPAHRHYQRLLATAGFDSNAGGQACDVPAATRGCRLAQRSSATERNRDRYVPAHPETRRHGRRDRGDRRRARRHHRRRRDPWVGHDGDVGLPRTISA